MKQDAAEKRPQPYGLGTERQAQIAEIVRERGHAKVDDLATTFGVTTQTIRKDINAMCEKGLLRRVHGGVELAVVNAGHYELRRVLNLTAKRRIGQAAAQVIPDRTTLAVSIGTTLRWWWPAWANILASKFSPTICTSQ